MTRSLSRRLAFLLFFACAGAAAATPEGLWQTMDDHSGQVRAIVRIVAVGGEYQGRIEKTFPQPGEAANPVCEACDGERRGQPLAGMLIVERMRQDGDEFVGGQILDPENGTTYRCRMSLADNGRKLIVRGYIGISLFGRSQTWLRAGQ